ncbi:MAG: hypothetical protein NZ927_08600 [Candidatus Calescibacterium sp.]|nr:hypothetical protein [Candidatus Calescibacterium sp.]MDW8087546.1 hypothetical protein [Candidatus Calescibacterium sp.]
MIIPFVFALMLHHEEATVDHIAKTAFGFNSVFARREIIPSENKNTFVIVPFAEYSFLELKAFTASIRADVPFGFVLERFYFSDLAGTVRATFGIGRSFSITPLISTEFPTGGDLATSDHVSLFPALAFEMHVGAFTHIHLHGVIGYKLALGGNHHSETEGDHSDHSDHSHAAPSLSTHKANYLFPHSEKEIMSHIGVMFGILEVLAVDIRPNFFLEDMNKFVFQPMLGLVLSIPTDYFSVRSNLYGFWALGGVRKGYGVGLLSYILF